MSNKDSGELILEKAQKIFGYFDKSFLIELIEYLFKGDEKKVIENYRKSFDAGIDPKLFLNDFLEVLYYIKNINSISLGGTNFNLNDSEFKKIVEIANKTNVQEIILFWQFTIKTIDELEIVSNPNLSVEMFLIRLIYLKGFKIKDDLPKHSLNLSVDKQNTKIDKSVEMVNQIKNVAQEDKIDPKLELDKKKTEINSFQELLNFCNTYKEVQLKY